MDRPSESTSVPRLDASTRPKYARLKSHLLEELRSGRLKPGDALPTELELAAKLAVARGTVRQALAELDREGVIRRIRGKGTFIAEEETPSPVEPLPLSSRLDVYALVLPETRGGHYPELVHGFEEAAGRLYKQVILSSSDNDLDQQGRVFLQLLEKGVSGVAVVPATQPTPPFQVQAMQRQGIPVVFCHRPVEGAAAPLLAIPFEEVGRRSAEAVAERGHRRVAVVMSASNTSTDARVAGFRRGLQLHGISLREEDIQVKESTLVGVEHYEQPICEFLDRVMARDDHPTAIMASYDPFGEIVYLHLQHMGLRVPEDVSIVSFGSKERRGAIVRRLTSVVIDGSELGHRAVGLLEEMRSGRRPLFDDSRIDLPLAMSEGTTLGPAPRLQRATGDSR